MTEISSIVAIPKTRKQEKMFSDLELAIVALVFVFFFLMLERRNDNVRERTQTRKPRKRTRITRHHCDNLYQMIQRGPEENTDEERQ